MILTRFFNFLFGNRRKVLNAKYRGEIQKMNKEFMTWLKKQNEYNRVMNS